MLTGAYAFSQFLLLCFFKKKKQLFDLLKNSFIVQNITFLLDFSTKVVAITLLHL